jgi:hypothetical protein
MTERQTEQPEKIQVQQPPVEKTKRQWTEKLKGFIKKNHPHDALRALAAKLQEPGNPDTEKPNLHDRIQASLATLLTPRRINAPRGGTGGLLSEMHGHMMNTDMFSGGNEKYVLAGFGLAMLVGSINSARSGDRTTTVSRLTEAWKTGLPHVRTEEPGQPKQPRLKNLSPSAIRQM